MFLMIFYICTFVQYTGLVISPDKQIPSFVLVHTLTATIVSMFKLFGILCVFGMETRFLHNYMPYKYVKKEIILQYNRTQVTEKPVFKTKLIY